MSRTFVAKNARRLQPVLITLLVILGTLVSLLLAHSLEGTHPGELTRAMASSASSAVVAATAEDSQGVAAASSSADDFLDGSFALCAALGIACGLAFLIVFIQMRKRPVMIARSRTDRWTIHMPRGAIPAFPVTLSALCISRV